MVRANTTGGRLGDDPRDGVCFDNRQDFLGRGAILHRRHPVRSCHKPKNISFPLNAIAGV